MVPQYGIEPHHSPYKSEPLPLRIQGHGQVFLQNTRYKTGNGVGDRNRTYMTWGCNPVPSRSGHANIKYYALGYSFQKLPIGYQI